jgi:competence protein ComEA
MKDFTLPFFTFKLFTRAYASKRFVISSALSLGLAAGFAATPLWAVEASPNTLEQLNTPEQPIAPKHIAPKQIAPEQKAATQPSELTRVSINSADAATLAEHLVGIGPAKADAIVAWRNENGRFSSVEQLLEIKGIGQAILDKNKTRISL